jgi:hypothetical protein
MTPVTIMTVMSAYLRAARPQLLARQLLGERERIEIGLQAIFAHDVLRYLSEQTS